MACQEIHFNTLTGTKTAFSSCESRKRFKSDYGEEFKNHLKHIKPAMNDLIALVERREVGGDVE
jgi:hypothetical protein